jgi:hypothetical protein
MYACRESHFETTASLLLNKGANLNYENQVYNLFYDIKFISTSIYNFTFIKNRKNAFMEACFGCWGKAKFSSATFLIEMGAEVNYRTKQVFCLNHLQNVIYIYFFS